MNIVILTGRTTSDIELKKTPNGISVATFALAVDRRKSEEADFPTVVVWRQLAEFAADHITKGRKLVITGELRTRNYEDREGRRRKVTEVHASRIEFADAKPPVQKAAEPGDIQDEESILPSVCGISPSVTASPCHLPRQREARAEPGDVQNEEFAEISPGYGNDDLPF